jgi:hypothetical protein
MCSSGSDGYFKSHYPQRHKLKQEISTAAPNTADNDLAPVPRLVAPEDLVVVELAELRTVLVVKGVEVVVE